METKDSIAFHTGARARPAKRAEDDRRFEESFRRRVEAGETGR